MGIKFGKNQQVIREQPVFTVPNMAKSISHSSITQQYKFIQSIGKGSFSDVFKAKAIKTGHIRAIKKIDTKKYAKMEALILNEFDILKELDHPNIMKVYRIYEQYSYIYIVTQLCKGKQLFQFIALKKTFTQSEACHLFYQLASAVNHLHQNKIMHRDLKPQNIMYDSESQTLKLVDFGSACRYEVQQCQKMRRIGTSYYIAPQVLDRFYNYKCDIWSLAVILHILLCGQPPFKGKNDEQIIKLIQTQQINFSKPCWKSISQKAIHLLKKMFSKNIEERYNIKQVINHQWFKQNLNFTEKNKTFNEKNLIECLNNMKSYNDYNSSSIQQGMLVFIVNFIKSNQDQQQMLKCFKALDLNGDGVLSFDQLKKGMGKYLSLNEKDAQMVAKKIFNKIDINKSGQIDYSQFILSAVNIEVAVSEDNLDLAFQYLDNDGNGKLSAKQIRQMLGQNVSQQTYIKLIAQFDKDRDGQITKQEFKGMMKKIIHSKKKI